MEKLPDFIVIGAGKAGTTSLHHYLSQHPQIYLCPQKETYFFLPEDIRQKHKPWGAVTSLEDYVRLFQAAPDHNIVGEISTNYYAYGQSAHQIYEALPQVKILAILRHPAERAFSSYQMHVREGDETRSFPEVISPTSQYVQRGFYHAQLEPFFAVFPPENIKILFFEDYSRSPITFLQDLFTFISVDPTFTPDVAQRHRTGGLPKQRWVNTLLTQRNPVRSVVAGLLRRVMPLEARQSLRSTLVARNTAQVKLDPASRDRLIALYREDILRLQEHLNRDLSAWLQ